MQEEDLPAGDRWRDQWQTIAAAPEKYLSSLGRDGLAIKVKTASRTG